MPVGFFTGRGISALSLPLALIAMSAAAAVAPTTAAALALAGPPLDDAGYWSVADAQVQRLDRFWRQDDGAYRPGGDGADPNVNANLLLVHAVAARRGHAGPARNDHRARTIARRLVASPPFVERPGSGTQGHAPGWVNSLDSPSGQQHLVFDAPVVEGLAAAWRARTALALPEETVGLIEDRIHRVARSPFYRYPAIRLNQINWYALVYAAAATVAGDRHLLRHDLLHQLRRFVAGIGATASAAGNLAPSGRFNYLPHEPATHPMNVDSAEYANVVLGVTRFLGRAREAGMPLSRGTRATLRQWATRAIGAYWTHAGYLNWDSGLGFDRWHQAKKIGLAQEALVGIATDRTLGIPRRTRQWAKHILDAGLLLYERLARRTGDVAPGVLFGLDVVPQGAPAARLGAARVAANAARAIDAGLGRARSAVPPALYSYDPDIGRVAVTTPNFNTAIVAVNSGAFPYGGIELARLFDGRQDVAANIGGRPPAAFGLEVRARSGRRLLATQAGRRGVVGHPGVRLLRAAAARHVPGSRLGAVSGGAFRTLRVAGRVRERSLTARTRHRFTSRHIDVAWRLRDRSGERPRKVVANFPSWGADARIEARLRAGGTVRLGREPIPVSRVRALLVRSRHSGYRISVRRAPRTAVVAARPVRRQPSAPAPGPTAGIRLVDGRVRRLRFAIRIVVRPALRVREAGA